MLLLQSLRFSLHDCDVVFILICYLLLLDATLMCLDCTFDGKFLCSQCDTQVHANALLHVRKSFDKETNGFVPCGNTLSNLKPSHCSNCKIQFGGPATCEEIASNLIYMLTTRCGPISVNVFTVKCVKCEALVGESSADYHFIAGADDIWVQEELLEEIEGYYIASNYRLSSGSIWASYRARSLKRGWNECGGRSFQDALHRAFRIFVAVKENFNSGGMLGTKQLIYCNALRAHKAVWVFMLMGISS